MAENMADQEGGWFTFSDEDFDRRYSTEDAAASEPGAGKSSGLAAEKGIPSAPRIGRSRNKFMRTLLRRRLASSGLT